HVAVPDEGETRHRDQRDEERRDVHAEAEHPAHERGHRGWGIPIWRRSGHTRTSHEPAEILAQRAPRPEAARGDRVATHPSSWYSTARPDPGGDPWGSKSRLPRWVKGGAAWRSAGASTLRPRPSSMSAWRPFWDRAP